MLANLWIEELAAQRFEALERALLIRPHQPRIPRDIGGEDRGEPAGRGHSSGKPTRRNPTSSVFARSARYAGSISPGC